MPTRSFQENLVDCHACAVQSDTGVLVAAGVADVGAGRVQLPADVRTGQIGPCHPCPRRTRRTRSSGKVTVDDQAVAVNRWAWIAR